MRKTGLLAMMLMLFAAAGLLAGQQTFADEAEETVPEPEKIRLDVTVGEHGSVNGQTQDFTQEMNEGASCALIMEAEEGYLTGEILVNGEQLPEGEKARQEGNSETKLLLENLLDSAEISVSFKRDPNEEDTAPGAAAGKTVAGGPETEPGSGGSEAAPGPAAGGPAPVTEGTGASGAEGTAAAAAAEPAGKKATEKDEEKAARDDGPGTSGTGAAADDGEKDEAGSGSGPDPAGASERSADKAGDSSPATGDGFPACFAAAMFAGAAAFAGLLLRRKGMKR